MPNHVQPCPAHDQNLPGSPPLLISYSVKGQGEPGSRLSWCGDHVYRRQQRHTRYYRMFSAGVVHEGVGVFIGMQNISAGVVRSYMQSWSADWCCKGLCVQAWRVQTGVVRGYVCKPGECRLVL